MNIRNLYRGPWNLFKNHKKKSIAGLVTVLIVASAIVRGGNQEVLKINDVQAGSVIQEVSISGRVVSAQAINLSFEQSGKINHTPVKSGQQIKAGTVIAQLDARDAQRRVRDAQINLEQATIGLSKLTLNQQTDRPKFQDALVNAQDDLSEAYKSGFNAVASAFIDMPDIIAGAEDVLYDTTVEPGNFNTNAYGNIVPNDKREEMRTIIKQAEDKYKVALGSYNVNFANYRNATRTSLPFCACTAPNHFTISSGFLNCFAPSCWLERRSTTTSIPDSWRLVFLNLPFDERAAPRDFLTHILANTNAFKTKM